MLAQLLFYSVIPSFCYCHYLGVSIPSPCVFVLFRSVLLFLSRLIFFFGVRSICSLLFTQCHWCLLPCSFLCGAVSFCSASASFGSPVPFAKWFPFGTSQGLLCPLYLSILRGPSMWWSPFCLVSPFPSSSASFASMVPLAPWSPFGVSLPSHGALSSSGSFLMEFSFSSLFHSVRV